MGKGVANGEVDEDYILKVFWSVLAAKLEYDDDFIIISKFYEEDIAELISAE